MIVFQLYFAIGNLIVSYLLAWILSSIAQFPFLGLEHGLLVKSKLEAFRCARNPLDNDDDEVEDPNIKEESKPVPQVVKNGSDNFVKPNFFEPTDEEKTSKVPYQRQITQL